MSTSCDFIQQWSDKCKDNKQLQQTTNDIMFCLLSLFYQ